METNNNNKNARKLKSYVVETMKTAKKVGKDDVRRVVHGAKVGLGLTIVSMLYYFRPLYEGFGQAGMWAILTVVVVFEFTVGGTLSKSLNRGFATLVAGALGLGAEYLADLCGQKGEPIVLGILVFLLAAISTFTRFFPNVKRRYDYGVVVFILTFTMVAVSGFRVDQILQLAHQRLSTIVIGGSTCMVISIFVYPVWAGQDLHNLVADNIEKLAIFLEGFGGELLLCQGNESSKSFSKENDKSFLQSYKSVINSKANEESLANFAWWEPPHGKFKFGHPWKQYLKIGALVWECACLIEALNSCINSKSQSQVASSEIQTRIQKLIAAISAEAGKALRHLSTAMKNSTLPQRAAVEAHSRNYRAASHDLTTALEDAPPPSDWKPGGRLRQIMPLLVIASVLIDVTVIVDELSVSVHEFSEKACFGDPPENLPVLHRGIVNPVDDDYVAVDVRDEAGGRVSLEKRGATL
ncbi:Aluminum-activated malate transporter 2 [Striga hermonthica]|uniref:Aluminum-activated malate transporter 2 n=1 Tax=Striga hermonthica TaxID=68872 RepID=A0A9N7RU31_STRHE|nr:Aluminum-activated malate transporter 2 [Striga hermonthica]